jgi:hypothetical protein
MKRRKRIYYSAEQRAETWEHCSRYFCFGFINGYFRTLIISG